MKKIIIVLILISLPFIYMARAKQKANDAQIPNAQVLKTYTPWATLKINQVNYDITPFIGKTALEALNSTAPNLVSKEKLNEMIVHDKKSDITPDKYIIQDMDTIEWK